MALSINLEKVLKVPGITGRAVEVLLILGAVLVLAIPLLMPGQGAQAAALEIVVVAISMLVWMTVIQVRTPRKELGLTRANFAVRVMGDDSGPVLLLVGGVSLWTQAGGGLYWVVPALIAAMVAAIVGAWVMLVEILR